MKQALINCGLAILFAAVFLGAGAFIAWKNLADPADNREPTIREQRQSAQLQRREYRASMLAPQHGRKCAFDWRDGCLVCKYRTSSGTVKSTMC